MSYNGMHTFDADRHANIAVFSLKNTLRTTLSQKIFLDRLRFIFIS